MKAKALDLAAISNGQAIKHLAVKTGHAVAPDGTRLQWEVYESWGGPAGPTAAAAGKHPSPGPGSPQAAVPAGPHEPPGPAGSPLDPPEAGSGPGVGPGPAGASVAGQSSGAEENAEAGCEATAGAVGPGGPGTAGAEGVDGSSGVANVIMIMGLAAGRDGWLPLIHHWMAQADSEPLHRLRVRFAVFDNRGIGGSDTPAARAAYSTPAMARDALAVMDHLGWREAHVVGFSMGGMVALKLGALAPHRVLSLTALSVSGGGWQAVPTRWRTLKLLAFMVSARTPQARAQADVHFHFSPRVLQAQIPATADSGAGAESAPGHSPSPGTPLHLHLAADARSPPAPRSAQPAIQLATLHTSASAPASSPASALAPASDPHASSNPTPNPSGGDTGRTGNPPGSSDPKAAAAQHGPHSTARPGGHSTHSTAQQQHRTARSVEAALIEEYVATAASAGAQAQEGLLGQLSAVWHHGVSGAEAEALRSLAEGGVPFKVLHGHHDAMARPEYGQRSAQRLGAAFVALEGGHFIVRECAPEVAMHLADSIATAAQRQRQAAAATAAAAGGAAGGAARGTGTSAGALAGGAKAGAGAGGGAGAGAGAAAGKGGARDAAAPAVGSSLGLSWLRWT
ncbi:hypothetical protein HYH03_010633 [Edaphochlamys debaryana]|uniref:AB hydrolase-1 domain-containing protein n=1 Tax=Edaphochlamys debaryana TaxID=47281 RepID=A0A835XYW4_9CHLO|nr:hypothetical protein HYH03_010633 [Edaphochlamys debaryana]|eukprot:KAG2490956.1 hypothetical protein HYH03_010633 [Edaphochlamys debaryana]